MLSNFLGVKAVCYETGPNPTHSGHSARAAFRTEDNEGECLGQQQYTRTRACTHTPAHTGTPTQRHFCSNDSLTIQASKFHAHQKFAVYLPHLVTLIFRVRVFEKVIAAKHRDGHTPIITAPRRLSQEACTKFEGSLNYIEIFCQSINQSMVLSIYKERKCI